MVLIELHRGKGPAREREGGGGDQFETQRLLLPIYKREERAEIPDPSYRRQNFTFFEEFK